MVIVKALHLAFGNSPPSHAVRKTHRNIGAATLRSGVEINVIMPPPGRGH